MVDVDSRVGRVLRGHRRRVAMQQDDLSRGMVALGFPMSSATVGKIERGERRVTIGEAVALASVLKVDPLALTRPGPPVAETNYSVAPGEYMLEWAVETGGHVLDLAAPLDLSTRDMMLLVNGERALTPKLAHLLHEATGIPARMWLAHERGYRADEERLWKERDDGTRDD